MEPTIDRKVDDKIRLAVTMAGILSTQAHLFVLVANGPGNQTEIEKHRDTPAKRRRREVEMLLKTAAGMKELACLVEEQLQEVKHTIQEQERLENFHGGL